MSNAGNVNAHVKSRGPAIIVELEMDGKTFEVALRQEWAVYSDEDLIKRAIVVFHEERDKYPGGSLSEIGGRIVEHFITEMTPLPFSAEVPGTYRYEFTIAGQPSRHQLQITVQAAAVLFEENGQPSLQQAEQVLHAWLRINHITKTDKVPEKVVITTHETDTMSLSRGTDREI